MMIGARRLFLTTGRASRCLFRARVSPARCFASVVNDIDAPTEPAILLRGYQEEAIQSVLAYLENGHKRLGLSLATGSGKTVIFTHLIARIKPQTQHADQTLILVHRRELLEQAVKHCHRTYPKRTIEIEQGTQHASGLADITVASVRSLVSRDRLLKYDPRRFKLLLVDEAHHIVASSYMEVLEHFGLISPTSVSPALVGVSATFSRFDGLSLGAAIDHIVYHKDYLDMIDGKYLADVIFTTVKSSLDLSQVKINKDGDFDTNSLAKAACSSENYELLCRSYLNLVADRHSTVVFCIDQQHARELAAMFRDRFGISADYVTGSHSMRDRQRILQSFRAGEIKVLCNCQVLTEGTDIPNIDCVILARPTRSRNLLVQMIGRGVRLHPGKENCHVIDMAGSLQTGIVTVPTLFGLDSSELVHGQSVQDMKELKEKQIREAENGGMAGPVGRPRDISNTNVTFTHYDSVKDLIDDTSSERHIRSLSRLAWVQVDNDKYILATSDAIMVIDKSSCVASSYKATSKFAIPDRSEKKYAPWTKPRQIATADTLENIVHAADTYAEKNQSYFPRFATLTSQAWRKSPASEAQLSFLNSKKIGGRELTGDLVTKGQAGDMMTKLKFGAKGRFARFQTEKRKEQREEHKLDQLEDLRNRETVRVGPLLSP